jgi:hypothetical protein
MHPRQAAELLYRYILKRYEGIYFVDAVGCRGENFIVVYVDDAKRCGLRHIDKWEGFRVLLRNLRTLVDVKTSCEKDC